MTDSPTLRLCESIGRLPEPGVIRCAHVDHHYRPAVLLHRHPMPGGAGVVVPVCMECDSVVPVAGPVERGSLGAGPFGFPPEPMDQGGLFR